MRERLIELLLQYKEHPEKTCPEYDTDTPCKGCKYDLGEDCDITGRFADHLLANGVIVPPCKVGDTLYAVTYDRSRVVASEVRNLSHLVRLIEDECFGEWVFTTEADAEKALMERSGG